MKNDFRDTAQYSLTRSKVRGAEALKLTGSFLFPHILHAEM
jgi:hypothetical protein